MASVAMTLLDRLTALIARVCKVRCLSVQVFASITIDFFVLNVSFNIYVVQTQDLDQFV